MRASNNAPELYIGLMSGTSIDAVDGVLVSFEEPAADATSDPLRANTIATASAPFPPALRERLIALQTPAFDDLEAAARAGLEIARVYAGVVDQLLQGRSPRSVKAVGAHGQTVRHKPASGYTLQLLSGAHLAEYCGIDVVCDFRSADMAAGGQGAPLVPAFHRGMFASPARRRAVVNIGGIANVSLLAPNEPVAGHDTGPGNTLMDAWVAIHQARAFDDGGQWAASARFSPALLAAMKADPYFHLKAPKSTHRDYFSVDWLRRQIHEENPAEVQSTLCELTCTTVSDAVQAFAADEVYVCGGGARNLELMRRLQLRLAPALVSSTQLLGIDPQSVEALAFAWLARQRLQLQAGNEVGATGAIGRRVLGAWYPAVR